MKTTPPPEKLPKLADYPEWVAIQSKRKELQEKLAQVSQKRDAILAALNDQATRRRPSLELKAAELLGGKELEEIDCRPVVDPADLGKLNQEIAIVREAIRLFEERSRPVISGLRKQITAAATPRHNDLARRVGAAFDNLFEAISAEDAFREEVRLACDGVTHLPNAGFPNRTPHAFLHSYVDLWRKSMKEYLAVPQVPPETLPHWESAGRSAIPPASMRLVAN